MKWTTFFKRQKLSKLTQEDINNLNIPTSIKEIESAINNLSKRNHQSQVISLMNSTKIKGGNDAIFYDLF